jgi:hypothetical protein
MNQFRARFPDPSAITDLERWRVFEYGAPQTFAGMYQFGVRKGSAADDGTECPTR